MQNDQFGSYQQPPSPAPERRSYTADDLGYTKGGGLSLLKNPVVATLVLLVTAGVFAGIIMMAIPDNSDDVALPIIKADSSPIKLVPDDRGGADIPNRESTIFAEMRDAGTEPLPRVENLLSIDAPYETVDSGAVSGANLTEAINVPPPTGALVVAKQEEAAEAMLEKPKSLHPAGASPDTIAFVKSVLEKQDELNTPAVKIAKTEPAAGVDVRTKTNVMTGGTHYVQLASITDEARAAKEWTKLQKKYAALSDSKYRVERKDLGAKGVFYRIQAGPFSKDVASSKCNAVIAAAGGCFVVAK